MAIKAPSEALTSEALLHQESIAIALFGNPTLTRPWMLRINVELSEYDLDELQNAADAVFLLDECQSWTFQV